MMILDKFFLKYEGGVGDQFDLPPPGKSTLKKPSLIKVNTFSIITSTSAHMMDSSYN